MDDGNTKAPEKSNKNCSSDFSEKNNGKNSTQKHAQVKGKPPPDEGSGGGPLKVQF